MANTDGPLFLYKAKVKELRDEMGEMKEELDGFKSICNEYLESEDSSWKELSSWCDQKTDEIAELKDEGGDYQYDLEELQGELEPLNEFMSDLTGVCNYEDLIDYIKGIQENSVPKEILFAEREGAKQRYQVAIKQVNDLMEQVEKQKGINQMLMDAIDAASEKLDQYESGDNSI